MGPAPEAIVAPWLARVPHHVTSSHGAKAGLHERGVTRALYCTCSELPMYLISSTTGTLSRQNPGIAGADRMCREHTESCATVVEEGMLRDDPNIPGGLHWVTQLI